MNELFDGRLSMCTDAEIAVLLCMKKYGQESQILNCLEDESQYLLEHAPALERLARTDVEDYFQSKFCTWKTVFRTLANRDSLQHDNESSSDHIPTANETILRQFGLYQLVPVFQTLPRRTLALYVDDSAGISIESLIGLPRVERQIDTDALACLTDLYYRLTQAGAEISIMALHSAIVSLALAAGYRGQRWFDLLSLKVTKDTRLLMHKYRRSPYIQSRFHLSIQFLSSWRAFIADNSDSLTGEWHL